MRQSQAEISRLLVDLKLTTVGVLLAACSAGVPEDPAHDPSAFTLRDSAGIRIAESSDSEWTSATQWQVDAQPYLEIGTRDGSRPGTDFGRVGPIVRFGDGRIAAADLQSLEIRVFSSSGHHTGVWARGGSGPGEIQRVDALAVIRGDSLVIRNDGIFRHEVFGPTGSYGRTVRAPPSSWLRGGGRAAAWLEDGTFILGPANVPLTVRDAGRVLLHGEWHLFDPTGAHVRLLARLPERWVESVAGVNSPIPVLYGARAHVAGTPRGLWYGFPASFEIRRIGPGGVDRIVRRAWTPEEVSRTMRQGYTEWYQAQVNRLDVDPVLLPEVVLMRRLEAQQRSAGLASQVSHVFADTLPAFTGLVASTDDHLWVRLPRALSELERTPERMSTNQWSVFDPDGRWLGTVGTPLQLDVRIIGPDYVLGVWKDDLDVEYVRLHKLIKPASE